MDKLTAIHADRAKAIVKATDFAVPRDDAPQVEVIKVGANAGLLTVPYSARLQKVPGVSLAQILPDRYIIVLAEGMSFVDVEIAILDQIDMTDLADDGESLVVRELLQHLRSLRRSERVNMAEVILVSIDD